MVFLREAEEMNFFLHELGAHLNQNGKLLGSFSNRTHVGRPDLWFGLPDQDCPPLHALTTPDPS